MHEFALVDRNYYFHTVWLALATLLQNDPDKSRHWLDQIAIHELNGFHRALTDSIKIGLIAHDTDLNNRDAIHAIKSALRQTRNARKEIIDSEFSRLHTSTRDAIGGTQEFALENGRFTRFGCFKPCRACLANSGKNNTIAQ